MKLLLILLLTISTAFAVTFAPETAVKDGNHFSYTATTAQDSSIAVKIDEKDGYSMSVKVTEATPAAFIIGSTLNKISTFYNNFIQEGHGLVTGASINITTSDTLPAGLENQAGYFVSKIDDDTFYIMSTRANAIAGTPAIVLTDQGVGLQTFTPSGSYRGDIAVQYSLNGEDWNDIVHYGDTATTYLLEDDDFNANWLRLAVQATQGQILLEWDLNAK